MSSLIISGDTSGTVIIAAPAVAGSGTLTLPTGTDTLVGLAATQTLTNKSIAATQLTGTVAAARLPAGSVLQVVQTVKLTSFSSSSTSFVDVTGLTATITPSSASSKVLVTVSLAAGAGSVMTLNLLRGATSLLNPTTMQTFSASAVFFAAGIDSTIPISFTCLDSPATTSATVYKIQTKTNTSTIFIGNRVSTADMEQVSTVTLMEIAG